MSSSHMAREINRRFSGRPGLSYKQYAQAASVLASAAGLKKVSKIMPKGRARDLGGSPFRPPKKKASKQQLNLQMIRMKRNIKDLKKIDDQTTGTMTYRRCRTGSVKSQANAQNAEFLIRNKTTDYETALQNLKYFNPAVPGTLTTASASSGTYQRNILIQKMSHAIDLRNNYQVDADVLVYLCTVRDDTNQSVTDAWNSGVPDGSNLTDLTDLNQYPTDYNLVKDLYNLKRVYRGRLKPGQSHRVSHAVQDVEYDSSTVDTHSLTYQKEYKTFGFLVIVKGTLSHDTATLAEQGLQQAAVDYESVATMTVKYSAGINISFTHVSNTYDAFTSSGVQSQKPIPDNVSYSVG